MSRYSSSAGQYSTQPSIPPHPNYYGQIHFVNASLVQPYFDICEEALHLLDQNALSRCGADTRTSIRKARSKVKQNTKSWSPPRPAIGGENDIPNRPAIVCRTPAGCDRTKVWLFLMGTFGGRKSNTIPAVLKEFAVRVHTKDLPFSESGESSVHTTPEWDAHGRSAWVILIPVTTIDGLLPVQRWERYGQQYYVEPEELRLSVRSRDMMRLFRAKVKEPLLLARFVQALCNRHTNDVSRHHTSLRSPTDFADRVAVLVHLNLQRR